MFVKKLKNKLTILTIDSKSSAGNVEVGLCVLGGIRTESSKCLEYYHLLEHLMQGFPCKATDQNREYIDKYKMRFGAQVSNYITHAYVNTESSQPEACTIMLDIVLSFLENANITEELLTSSKNVIIIILIYQTQLGNLPETKRKSKYSLTAFC